MGKMKYLGRVHHQNVGVDCLENMAEKILVVLLVLLSCLMMLQQFSMAIMDDYMTLTEDEFFFRKLLTVMGENVLKSRGRKGDFG